MKTYEGVPMLRIMFTALAIVGIILVYLGLYVSSVIEAGYTWVLIGIGALMCISYLVYEFCAALMAKIGGTDV
jgi:hypothetical protein